MSDEEHIDHYHCICVYAQEARVNLKIHSESFDSLCNSNVSQFFNFHLFLAINHFLYLLMIICSINIRA